MFGPYVKVLRTPGAARFSLFGAVARLNMSMAGIGAVMLLSAERGSFAIAGTVTALFAVSMALISPQVSRLIDVYGQRKIVPYQLMVTLPSVVGLVLVATTTELNWPLYVLAAICGASQPMVGSLVRTRWTVLLKGKPELRTAFAWESIVDEIVFVAGPPVATVLALWWPPAGISAATIFLAVGTVMLLTQKSTEPVPSGRAMAAGGRPAILLPGMAGIFGVFVMLGMIFGSVEVITVAFTDEAGQPGMAGLVLALYSAGSLAGGLVYGTLKLRHSLLKQFIVGIIVLGLVALPLPFLGTVPMLAGGVLLAGLAVAPVLIIATALVEQIVPSHRLTESMAWTSSGLSAGIALGAPLSGVLIDTYDGATAFYLPAAAGVGAVLFAVIVLNPLRRAVRAAALRAVELPQDEIVTDAPASVPALADQDPVTPEPARV